MTPVVDDKSLTTATPAAFRLGRISAAFHKFASTTKPRLDASDKLKLDRQLLEALAERSAILLSLVFPFSLVVLEFGSYSPSITNWSIAAWAAALWILMLAYFPLLHVVRHLPADASQRTLLTVNLVWAGWTLVLSLVWLSAAWLLVQQPPTPNQFVLGQRTFVYITILGQSITVLLLSTNRVAVFSMLISFFLIFYFALASHMGVSRTNLIVYFYGHVLMHFILAWLISAYERNVRARGILLESERIRADAERQRANRFIAAVSHDLRQPIATLSLKLSSLKTRASTPEMIDDIRSLRQQVDALESMVDGSLNLSRLESKTWSVRIRDVALQHVIDAVVTDLKPEAEAAGIQLEAISLPYIVRTDPAGLDRILRNLLGNALRYTPARGADATPGRILLKCAVEGDRMRISISDNGIGIPKDKFKDIFDEYVQLANPERNRAKGLGLGLSIVNGLARLLKYELEVESTEGKGSCFSVLLPYVAHVPTELRRRSGATETASDLGGMVVILTRGSRQKLLEGNLLASAAP
jgi:signal transduction histidine kinase